MSFCHSTRTFRSESVKHTVKPHIQRTSVNIENLNNTAEQSDADENNLRKDHISPELIQERIRAKLEPPIKRISRVTIIFNLQIDDNSAKNTPTAVPNANRPHEALAWQQVRSKLKTEHKESILERIRVLCLCLIFGRQDSENHFFPTNRT